jgi:hypothetical protein
VVPWLKRLDAAQGIFVRIEGGRHPLKRFELSMPNTSEATKERCYAQNSVDLVGNDLHSFYRILAR